MINENIDEYFSVSFGAQPVRCMSLHGDLYVCLNDFYAGLGMKPGKLSEELEEAQILLHTFQRLILTVQHAAWEMGPFETYDYHPDPDANYVPLDSYLKFLRAYWNHTFQIRSAQALRKED